jgi:hypothetical protein
MVLNVVAVVVVVVVMAAQAAPAFFFQDVSIRFFVDWFGCVLYQKTFRKV